ncbi:MAG: hypothetical protein CFE36_10930 [Sphingomonadaceae bacterium PASS1]|nr:MAG: hypothetical protein CFE36_10930 [Sphingomonadaceae bacterium PASS1]
MNSGGMIMSWLHVVHEDSQNSYRWYVLNRYGELIFSSCGSFHYEAEAKNDLSTFLVLMGRK